MGKLIVSTEMTADGVIDSIDEWFRPEGDHEDLSREQLLAADALLLGRQTYQGLAGVWPGMTDALGFANRMNSAPAPARGVQGAHEYVVAALDSPVFGNVFPGRIHERS
jgi:hypothetical protein